MVTSLEKRILYVAFLLAESTEYGNLRSLFYVKKIAVFGFDFWFPMSAGPNVLASLKFSCVAAWKYERFGTVII